MVGSRKAVLALLVALLCVLAATTCRKWNRPPDPPSEPQPDSGAVDCDTGQVLSWAGTDPDSDDDLVYDVYFGTSELPVQVDTATDSTRYKPKGLASSATYYWRVVARDRHGYEANSPLWQFRTERLNQAPNRPSRPFPDSGATAASVRTVLSWRGGDPDTQDSVTYDLYLGTSETPPLARQGLADTAYSPGELAYLTRYYWKVVARDDHGATTEGSLWTFTTSSNRPPRVPANPSPGQGAIGQPRRTVLYWTGGDPDTWDQVRYVVYFGTPALLSRADSNRAVDSFVVPRRLGYDSTYAWKIAAIDNHGARSEGPVWQFQTASPVQVTAPESLARVRALSAYTVTWTGGPGMMRTGERREVRVQKSESRSQGIGFGALSKGPTLSRLSLGRGHVRLLSQAFSPQARKPRAVLDKLPASDSTVIAFSTNGGSSWSRQGKATEPGRFVWTVPYSVTASGQVRVTEWVTGDTYVAQSGRFTVYDTLKPSRPAISSPGLDTVWPEAATRNIIWTGGTDGMDSAVIYYSPDNRANWYRQGRTTTPGIYRWRVPGPGTTLAFVKVIVYCLARRDSTTSFRFGVVAAPYPDTVVATLRLDSLAGPRALVWDSVDNLVYVANYGDSSVVGIDSINWPAATVRTGRNPVALAWNPRSNRLYVACEQGVVTVVDCATNAVVTTLAGGARPAAICVNTTSNKVYCASSTDSGLAIIDGISDSVLARLKTGAGPSAVCWHPTLNRVYVANFSSNTVSIIDGASDQLLATVPVSIGPVALDADTVNDQVFVVSKTAGAVTVIGADNQARPGVNVALQPQHVVFNPVRNRAYVACTGGNQVYTVDAESLGTGSFFVGSQPRALAWLDYGDKLYVANYGDRTVTVASCATNAVLKSIAVGSGPLALCWNGRTGRVYVANSIAGSISIIGH